MAYNSDYATSSNPQQPSKRDDRKIIYGVLIAALLLTWGYIIYDKSKTNESISQLQTQYTNVDSARNEVQNEYNDALKRLDALAADSTALQGDLAQRQSEIQDLKSKIESITKKEKATAGELMTARNLIKNLNGKIDNLFTEINRLRGENMQLASSNKQLKTDKEQLTTEKGQLQENLTSTEAAKADVENVASTLHASNMNITPIHIKNSGKEKETETAKRVDLLRITFNIDENRVAQSGMKELYVLVTDPNARPVTMASGSGNFDTREEGSKPYTSKVNIPYEKGKKSSVSFDWKQENQFQLGQYKIQVYHNGFKIGEGTKTLKKGGLFG